MQREEQVLKEMSDDFWLTLELIERGDAEEMALWATKNKCGAGYVKIITEHLASKKKANVTYASSLVGLQREIARKVLYDYGWRPDVPKAPGISGKEEANERLRDVPGGVLQSEGEEEQAPGDDGGVQGQGSGEGAGDSVRKGSPKRKSKGRRSGSGSRKRAGKKAPRRATEGDGGGGEDKAVVDGAAQESGESGPVVPERGPDGAPSGDGSGGVGDVPSGTGADGAGDKGGAKADAKPRGRTGSTRTKRHTGDSARLQDILLAFTRPQRDRYWKCIWWVEANLGNPTESQLDDIKRFLIERIAQDEPPSEEKPEGVLTPIPKKGLREIMAPKPRTRRQKGDPSQEGMFE